MTSVNAPASAKPSPGSRIASAATTIGSGRWLLPIEERVLGPEHRTTLHTRGTLAGWIGEAGDAAAARDHYAALLPVYERVLGPERPTTLHTRGTLAGWTGEAGDARPGPGTSTRRYCPLRSGCWAPSTRKTLTTRHALAQWTRRSRRRSWGRR